MAGLRPVIHDNARAVRRLDLHQETGFDRVMEIRHQRSGEVKFVSQ
jgi:hypothetical protein